jgi:hypothetical protein
VTLPTIPSSDADKDLRLLTLAWYRRARVAQLAHARQAGRLRKWNWWLGIPAAVLSALVGSAILSNLSGGAPSLVGMASLTTAVLVALQTFLRLDDRVRSHEAASRAFGQVRRNLGQLGAVMGRSRELLDEQLTDIRAVYDRVSDGTPNVAARVWASAKKQGADYWPEEFDAWPERR